MRPIKSLVLSSALCIVSAIAVANQPIDPRLDYAANGLSFAAQQLTNVLAQCQGDSHIVEDAQTLAYAAEHFKEEVELGPEDLDVDFRTITETYNETARELSQSNEIRFNQQARSAWFSTEEAFINLRQAWLTHEEQNGGDDDDRPRPPYVPQPQPPYGPYVNGYPQPGPRPYPVLGAYRPWPR